MTFNDFATGVEVAVRVFIRDHKLTSRDNQLTEEELWTMFEEWVRDRGLSKIVEEERNNDDIPF